MRSPTDAVSVHRGYPWCKGARTRREEDKQGDGEYPQKVQRLAMPKLWYVPVGSQRIPDGNLDGYQKKK
jgi:hypothetical protein